MHRTCRFVSVLSLLLMSGIAGAQASRTWVSGVGDDANPCSRTAPCKTFAGAISKTAAHGVINTLDGGGFGAVTITKSITIEAEGQVAGILSAGISGVIINAAATDRVVLRNLRINGFDTGLDGVRVLAAGEVLIENSVIENMVGNGVDVAPASGATQVTLRNCTIRDVATTVDTAAVNAAASGAGNVIMTIDGSRILARQIGVQLSGVGEIVIRDSVISGGLGDGVLALSATGIVSDILLDNTLVRDFGGAGLSASGNQTRIRVANSTISGNATGVFASNSGEVISFGDNRLVGNAANGTFSSTIARQ